MTLQLQTSTTAPAPATAATAPSASKEALQAPKAVATSNPSSATAASVRGK